MNRCVRAEEFTVSDIESNKTVWISFYKFVKDRSHDLVAIVEVFQKKCHDAFSFSILSDDLGIEGEVVLVNHTFDFRFVASFDCVENNFANIF